MMSKMRNNKKNNKVKRKKKRIKKTKIRINLNRQIRNYNKIKK